MENEWVKEIDRLKKVSRELENKLVLNASILEAINDVLDGNTISDFMESFPIVRQVFDLANSLIIEREDSVIRETKLKAINRELVEALEAMERIKDLWLPETSDIEHAGEAIALHAARNKMLAALKSEGV
jgi:cob(I)alamin adenosyltransferase